MYTCDRRYCVSRQYSSKTAFTSSPRLASITHSSWMANARRKDPARRTPTKESALLSLEPLPSPSFDHGWQWNPPVKRHGEGCFECISARTCASWMSPGTTLVIPCLPKNCTIQLVCRWRPRPSNHMNVVLHPAYLCLNMSPWLSCACHGLGCCVPNSIRWLRRCGFYHPQ